MAETQVIDFYDVGDEDDEFDEGTNDALHVERIPCARLIWKGESYELFQGDNLIGRDDVCEVTLDHKSISAKHAEISISEDRVAIIRDLRSANGTFVEHPVEAGQFQRLSVAHNRKELHHGMKVRFGMVCCEFSFQMERQLSVNGAETQMIGEPNRMAGLETQFLPDMDVDPDNSVARYHTALAIPDPHTVGSSGAPAVRFFPSSNSPVRMIPKEPSYGHETATMVDNATQLLLEAKVMPPGHYPAVNGSTTHHHHQPIEYAAVVKEEKPVVAALPGVRSTRVAGRVVVGATRTAFGPSGNGHDVPTQVDQELLRNTLRMTSENDDEDGDDNNGYGEGGGDGDDTANDAALAVTHVNVVGNARRVVVGQAASAVMAVGYPPAEEATLLLDEDHLHGHTGHGHIALANAPIPHVDEEEAAEGTADNDDDDDDDVDDQSQDIMQVDDAVGDQDDAAWLPSKAVDPPRVIPSPKGDLLTGPPLTKSNTLMEGDTDDDDDANNEVLPDTHVSTSTGSRPGTILPREDSTYLSTAVNSPQPSPMKNPRPEGVSTAVPTPDVTRTAVHTPDDLSAAVTPHRPLLSTVEEQQETAEEANTPAEERIAAMTPVAAAKETEKETENKTEGTDEVAAPTTPASQRRGTRKGSSIIDQVVSNEDIHNAAGSASVRQSRRKGKRSTSPTATANDDDSLVPPVTAVVDAAAAMEVDEPQSVVNGRATEEDDKATLLSSKAANDDLPPPPKRSRRGPVVGEKDATPPTAVTPAKTAAVSDPAIAPTPASTRGGRSTRRKRPYDEDNDDDGDDVGKGNGEQATFEVDAAPAQESTAVAAAAAAVPSSTGRSTRTRKVTMAVPSEETTVENDGNSHVTEDSTAKVTSTTAATNRSSSRTTAKRTSPNTTVVEEPTTVIQPEPATVRSRRSGKQPSRLEVEEPSTAATTAATPATSSSSSSSSSAAMVQAATSSSSAVEEAADADESIVLMFTKLEESAFQRYLRRLPQIRVTNDAREATHVLTTPELKRTPKLLVALNHRVRFVVTEAWLIDSAKQQRPLPLLPETCHPSEMPEPAYGEALQTCRYLVRDEEKETLWQFRLVDTLARIRYHPAATRQIFGQVAFFVTRGLMGETAPSVEDMRAIVESAGGVLCDDLTAFWQCHTGGMGVDDEEEAVVATASRRSTKSQRGSSQRSSAAASRSTTGSSSTSSGDVADGAAAGETLRGRTLVVVSHPSVVKKEIPRDLLQRLRRQATATQQQAAAADAAVPGGRVAPGVYSLEVLYRAVLRQELNLDVHQLDGFAFR